MAARVGTHYAYRTPHGLVTIATSDRGVTRVVFGDAPLPGERRPSELANRTATELLEYFAGKRRVHKNPLAVLVPDHRIVGAGGAPLGANARLRGALLALERASAGEGS